MSTLIRETNLTLTSAAEAATIQKIPTCTPEGVLHPALHEVTKPAWTGHPQAQFQTDHHPRSAATKKTPPNQKRL